MERAKRMLSVVLALALMLTGLPMYGMEVKAAEQSGDYKYEVNDDGNSVTITGYTGSGGDVVIPSEIDEKKVTIIGTMAFYGCRSLTGIEFPSGLTSIGTSAFTGCKGLTGIEIPSSVTYIGSYAFNNCSGLTGIEISSGVTEIEYDAFTRCGSLESIKVDAGNPKYDSRGNCNAIIEKESNKLIRGCKNTVIPSDVTSIGSDAFSGCSSLTTIKLPSGVTDIGSYAFSDCSGLTTIELPSGVTDIGSNAFSGCSGLTRIEISSGITVIGASAFAGCSSLESIKVDAGNPKYDSRGNCNAIIEKESNKLMRGCKNTVIPSDVTSIGSDAFSGYSSLTTIKLPSGVTDIGDNAFSGCSGLTTIELPSGVTDIGVDAFSGCSSLKGIELPSGITLISAGAFSDCSSLTRIKLPSGVTTIGWYVFENCSSLTGIEIPSSVTYIGIDVFEGCNENLVIYGEKGSYAETYAQENGFTFQEISDNNSSQGGDSKTDISKAAVTLEKTSYTYDGKAKTPLVTVKLGGKTLILNTDYTVAYSNNINVGTAVVTVTGKGSYTGSKTVNFTISKYDISKAAVTLEKASYTYDGKAKTPSATVKLDGKILIFNTDYTVTYSNNINVGTAKVTVSGKGNYTGTKSVDFTIVKAPENPKSSITCKKTVYKVTYGAKPFKINATSKSKMTFTSSSPKIVSVGKSTGKVTAKGTGVATITIKAGKDSVKVTVKVSPKKQSLKSVNTSKGRKLTVKWAKDKNATGYQVQVSTTKNFKKVAKQKKLAKNTYTFTKLKAGQKYYVRVRSYKKSGKETLYGTWSKVKQSSKVKK